MYVFISRKKSFFLLFCAFLTTAAIIFPLHYLFSGPKLGLLYDMLLSFRPPMEVSNELLLIDTEEIAEPGDIYALIMALNEMGASNLIIEVPVPGKGTGSIENAEDLILRVNDEFLLVSRNIQTLFESIRLGFVSPQESYSFVDSLVELSERGRDRIKAAVTRQEEAETTLAALAAAVFGRVIRAVDLRPQSEDLITEKFSWYSVPNPDKDMVLRRIAPIDGGVEHIAYYALKDRYRESIVENIDNDFVLINRFTQYGEITEHLFYLDQDGNILVEKPDNFRRITLDNFIKYDKADKSMAKLLKDSGSLGIYANILPEQMPGNLHDFSEEMKENLLKNPNELYFNEWMNARKRYLDSIYDFLNGPSEMLLVNGIEEKASAELTAEFEQQEPETEITAKMQAERNEIIRAFAALREQYSLLIALRNDISGLVKSSFCILKPKQNDSTAIMANTLLTGRSIRPGKNLHIIGSSFAAVFFILFLIHTLRPLKQALFGLFACLLCGAGFGAWFIYTAYWIDPLIPMAACAGGTAFLAISRVCIGYGAELKFRFAYSSRVNSFMLKQLAKKAPPFPGSLKKAHAAIIAVKNSRLSNTEDRKYALEAVKALCEFRKIFSEIFMNANATILGFAGDTAWACFGSPIERICGGMKDNAGGWDSREAVNTVNNLLNGTFALKGNSAFSDWLFGIESGECAFFWSQETGYSAAGQAVLRAKLYASLAKRYQVKAIIGENALNETDCAAKKIASLDGGVFYKFPQKN